jgi:trk system potassium uptake protein TrkH
MSAPKPAAAKNSPDDMAALQTLHPMAGLFLQQLDTLGGVTGVIAVIVIHGFRDHHPTVVRLLASTILAANLAPVVSLGLRYAWSLTRSTFLRENLVSVLSCFGWLAGLLVIRLVNHWRGPEVSPMEGVLPWSELIAMGRGTVELIRITRLISHARFNPALVLVLSFVTLIGTGTLLLMLPRCRPVDAVSADWLTALFTSTSACCVTGLVVVDTGNYWSRPGQCVILLLIQIGGLGIMTFGAFFAAVVGGRSTVREAATMADLLESEQLADVRGLIRSIIGFTIAIEVFGAILLSGLWADLPLGERAFQSVFHSVSAFCNAGFSTRTDNLLHWELRWQVWGVLAALIILGGFGFMPLDNLFRACRDSNWFRRKSPLALLPRRPTRLSLSTRMVSVTTLALLVGGTVVLWGLELNNPAFPTDPSSQLANAWFHSVTLRTAGFNTIDHAQLSASSKLFGIMLMFVGASPGSTGGGVKTICLAISILTLRAVLKGRTNVEVMKRTIPEVQVYRGLAVIALALTTLMVSSLLVISLERQPQLVLDHLYEVTSALGTVGVSTGVTAGLTPASKLVLVATMFLGRVGAITLVTALAGTSNKASYEYPEERIALG